MKRFLFTLLSISVIANFIFAQDIEEVVFTSSLVDSNKITNPLYVIDG